MEEPDSPVLVQQPSPPHTLGSGPNNGQLFSLPTTFSSESEFPTAAPQTLPVLFRGDEAMSGPVDGMSAPITDDQGPAELDANPPSTSPGTETLVDVQEVQENNTAGDLNQVTSPAGQADPMQDGRVPPVPEEAPEISWSVLGTERNTSAQNWAVPHATNPPEPHQPVVDQEPPPLPPPASQEPAPDVPDWVNIEEDTSYPDEEELKEIEGAETEMSALNAKYHERYFFQDVDDPEHRPIKKVRLSWTIKGVRGTKESPNRARVMNSPAAFVDGFYWHIKFYPRGNNSTALSAYIKCSRKPPKGDAEVPESIFRVYQGAPDVDLGNIPPEVEMKIPKTSSGGDKKGKARMDRKKTGTAQFDETTSDVASSSTHQATEAQVPSSTILQVHGSQNEDWRISAQLGMIIYNPAEPRTEMWMASEHQFNKHNDDWGWTNFTGPWNEIHIRHRGQRQALLRNDTLALDAYIRIFDDPTQALWWHSSPDSEGQWDSKSLAGYFPMGTPPLYHSPGVAGITAWLLLAPFRKILQNAYSSQWRFNSQVKPQPLICNLQLVLFLMRSMRREEKYVNVNPVLGVLESFGETYWDVKSFWEVFRRSIELELGENAEALAQIRGIFDGRIDGQNSFGPDNPLSIPVQGVRDVQTGIEKLLKTKGNKNVFPDFLPIMLERQQFDEKVGEWKLLYDRVRLTDELDLTSFSDSAVSSKYTLYGFMVHVGERCSGKFYSVLRPNGPGSKWLAFEDGDGNKVFSYTKRRIEKFEGLEGEELKTFKSTMQTAYLVMYIRTDRLKEYLPGVLEPFEISNWLKHFLASRWHGEDKEIQSTDGDRTDTTIEVYSCKSVRGRLGLLDMHNLKVVSNRDLHVYQLTMPATTTFGALRKQLCSHFRVDRPERMRLWIMSYPGLAEYMTASMTRVMLEGEIGREATFVHPLCLWMTILEDQKEVSLYGYPDPPAPQPASVQPSPPAESSERNADTERSQLQSSVAEQQTSSRSTEIMANGGPVSGANGPDDFASTDQDPQQAMLEESAPDLLQDSIADAVGSTTANINSSASANISATAELGEDPVPVHGHLVDAIQTRELESSSSDGILTPAGGPLSRTQESERLTNTASIQNADTSEHDNNLGTNNAEVPEVSAPSDGPFDTPRTDQTRSTSPTPVSEGSVSLIHPVDHTYGFIQLFDVEQQNFVVRKSFFAEISDDVKTTMRKQLEYPNDKEIFVWQRVKAYNTQSISSNTTFESIHFRDGVDLIVGDVLSDEKIDKLLAEGKFVNPGSLSRYLWMTDRRHPVLAFTGHKTILEFGGTYYSGPIVNGRYHGDRGVWITSNGHKYIGPFVADEKCGPDGTMVYQNGDTYIGSWLKDEKDGHGTLIEKRTGNKYVGGFRNGKRWGEGTTYWKVADEQRDLCQICYGEEVDALFYDCGHVCACVDCAKQCESCPICRHAIQKVVKMYRA